MNAALLKTTVLLLFSNTFMLTAWYFHLRALDKKAWWIAVFASWGIAFLEYCFHIPANRLGHAGGLSLSQLQILQIGLSLVLFVPFSILVMKQELRWDYVAAAVLLALAAWLIFAQPISGAIANVGTPAS